jgi:hypothetical protein
MRILNSTFLAETFFKMYDVVDACTIWKYLWAKMETIEVLWAAVSYFMYGNHIT